MSQEAKAAGSGRQVKLPLKHLTEISSQEIEQLIGTQCRLIPMQQWEIDSLLDVCKNKFSIEKGFALVYEYAGHIDRIKQLLDKQSTNYNLVYGQLSSSNATEEENANMLATLLEINSELLREICSWRRLQWCPRPVLSRPLSEAGSHSTNGSRKNKKTTIQATLRSQSQHIIPLLSNTVISRLSPFHLAILIAPNVDFEEAKHFFATDQRTMFTVEQIFTAVRNIMFLEDGVAVTYRYFHPKGSSSSGTGSDAYDTFPLLRLSYPDSKFPSEKFKWVWDSERVYRISAGVLYFNTGGMGISHSHAENDSLDRDPGQGRYLSDSYERTRSGERVGVTVEASLGDMSLGWHNPSQYHDTPLFPTSESLVYAGGADLGSIAETSTTNNLRWQGPSVSDSERYSKGGGEIAQGRLHSAESRFPIDNELLQRFEMALSRVEEVQNQHKELLMSSPVHSAAPSINHPSFERLEKALSRVEEAQHHHKELLLSSPIHTGATNKSSGLERSFETSSTSSSFGRISFPHSPSRVSFLNDNSSPSGEFSKSGSPSRNGMTASKGLKRADMFLSQSQNKRLMLSSKKYCSTLIQSMVRRRLAKKRVVRLRKEQYQNKRIAHHRQTIYNPHKGRAAAAMTIQRRVRGMLGRIRILRIISAGMHINASYRKYLAYLNLRRYLRRIDRPLNVHFGRITNLPAYVHNSSVQVKIKMSVYWSPLLHIMLPDDRRKIAQSQLPQIIVYTKHHDVHRTFTPEEIAELEKKSSSKKQQPESLTPAVDPKIDPASGRRHFDPPTINRDRSPSVLAKQGTFPVFPGSKPTPAKVDDSYTSDKSDDSSSSSDDDLTGHGSSLIKFTRGFTKLQRKVSERIGLIERVKSRPPIPAGSTCEVKFDETIQIPSCHGNSVLKLELYNQDDKKVATGYIVLSECGGLMIWREKITAHIIPLNPSARRDSKFFKPAAARVSSGSSGVQAKKNRNVKEPQTIPIDAAFLNATISTGTPLKSRCGWTNLKALGNGSICRKIRSVSKGVEGLWTVNWQKLYLSLDGQGLFIYESKLHSEYIINIPTIDIVGVICNKGEILESKNSKISNADNMDVSVDIRSGNSVETITMRFSDSGTRVSWVLILEKIAGENADTIPHLSKFGFASIRAALNGSRKMSMASMTIPPLGISAYRIHQEKEKEKEKKNDIKPIIALPFLNKREDPLAQFNGKKFADIRAQLRAHVEAK